MSATLGSTAPDFTLTDEERQPVTLSAARGKPVVLAFFPAAFSSVCTKELCTFRDSLGKLNRANAQVYGISVDTFFTLKAFHDSQQLTFPLLSDFNKQVIRDYGVFNEDMIGPRIAKRSVFVQIRMRVRHAVLEDAGTSRLRRCWPPSRPLARERALQQFHRLIRDRRLHCLRASHESTFKVEGMDCREVALIRRFACPGSRLLRRSDGRTASAEIRCFRRLTARP
jgi:peroxiredoxin